MTGEPLEFVKGDGMYCSSASDHFLKVICAPYCQTCGYPVWGEAIEVDFCQKCHFLETQSDGNRSVILLNLLGKQIVHDLKYHRGMYLLKDIERIVQKSQHIDAWVQNSVLVPVPLHARKLRERGYNQSALLADVFKNACGNAETVVLNLLVRIIDTDSQTRKDRKKRRDNVRMAFAVNEKLLPLDFDLPITIVDDVFTTGSTVNACVAELKRVGFKTVRSITFGHG